MDRAINLAAPEVRAILAGTKTQARRVLKPKPSAGVRLSPFVQSGIEDGHGRELRIPYAPGDRLWCRETWTPHSIYEAIKPRHVPKSRIFYAADGRYSPSNVPWRPSIHMPRWASRITLHVTDVRVERLQAISEADAVAEGFGVPNTRPDHVYSRWDSDPRDEFCELWDSLNARRPGCAWDDNPWIVAVTFRAETRNIDAALAA